MPKKRDSGDGTFRTLPNGTIEYTLSYGYDAYGKRQRKRFYGKNPTDCKRKAKDFLKELGAEKTAITNYTLSQWLDRWLKSYRGKRIQVGQRQIQQSTLDEYGRIAERVKAHKIASVDLVKIKPIMITDFFNDDLANYSHTVIKKTRFVLNAAFEAAIENDFCYKNPMRTAAIPQRAPGEKETFSDSDFDIINAYALIDNDFGLCMLLFLHAGLRSEELRAIGPKDINGRIVTVDKAIKETGELGPTKNGKPRRVVLPPAMAPKIAERLNPNDNYILGGESYVVRDTLRSKYDAFFNRMNKWLAQQNLEPIKRLPPHCCRHTYSTRARRKGIPIEIISALMGHSEKNVTEGYTHLDSLDDLMKATEML